jgi:hypothetical protein
VTRLNGSGVNNHHPYQSQGWQGFFVLNLQDAERPALLFGYIAAAAAAIS